ncbi:MAG TPA: hypothetical protein VIY86_06980, partial [Pirellulaceae bacterium]
DLWAKRANGTEDHHDLTRDINEVTDITFFALNGSDRMSVFVGELNPGVDVSQVHLDMLGGNGDDTFLNAKNAGINSQVYGGSGADVMTGGMGFDVFYGEGGADVLTGYEGTDLLSGGANNDTYVFGDSHNYYLGLDSVSDTSGIDTLDFSNWYRGVTVDLAVPGQQIASAGLFLQLGNSVIENVIGTANNDVLLGNSASNTLVGGVGFDRLEGRGANDLLQGGSGKDTYVFSGTQLGTDSIYDSDSFSDVADFRGFGQAVSVDLAKVGSSGYAVDNANLRIRLLNSGAVAEVYGTNYGDTLLGDSYSNWLHGGGGNDTVDGKGGRDWLYGDAGVDRLTVDSLDYVYGGLGNDYFNGIRERNIFGQLLSNPAPSRYLDWGVV